MPAKETMSTRTTYATAADLVALSAEGRRCELVEGEIREMAPAGARHGRAALRVGQRIAQYVEPRRIGEAFAAETGFRIRRDPDTVRAPDASFVSNERLPEGGLPSGFLDFAPDLAVEVVSPGDSADAVQSKAEGWLAAGARLVWVVYPESRSVVAYRSGGRAHVLQEGDSLDGHPVFEDFSLPIADLFN